jgi:hypothetical protein
VVFHFGQEHKIVATKMAIKTTEEGLIITKTVNGVKRISCSCCCFCRGYDLDLLLYGQGSGLKFDEYLGRLALGCGDEEAFEDLKPDDDYRKRQACYRWLCRETSLIDGQPVTISNSVGGPTTNNRDLNDLLFECLGERSEFAGLVAGLDGFGGEQYGRCYLYGFEFYGWRKPNIKEGGVIVEPSDWISSDLYYDVYVRDIPIPLE